MKRFFAPILFCLFTGSAFAQAEPTDFALTSPDILPAPVTFPGGLVTMSYKFYVTGNDFAFSSNAANAHHATIEFTFSKNDPLPPTGNGASLFTWVKKIVSTEPFLQVTYTGSSKDTIMYKTVPGDPSFHSRYNIIFADAVVTSSAVIGEKTIGSNGIFQDPSDPVVDPTPIDNHSGLFTYSIPPVVTPVTWLSFTAAKKNNTASLTWVTATEQNTKNFVVERSSNGAGFIELGIIKASGNSSTNKGYAFTDAAPVNGINSYRIKQVDNNGAYTYSEIKVLQYEGVVSIFISPNPASSELAINGLPQNAQLQVYAPNGQKILGTKTTGTLEKINVHKWAAGTYTVNVTKNGQLLYTARFVKK